MDRKHIAQLRANVLLLYQRGRGCAALVPVKARIVIALFFFGALLMAVHTALTAKDSSLHLRVQHSFHNALVSVWMDGDLVYTGQVSGFAKKRFGLIPTDSVYGSLSEIIPVHSGSHQVRVRIQPDDAATQEDSISGVFAHNGERSLAVSARQGGLSLSWRGTNNTSAETSTSLGFFSRYAGSLLLTIAGSIISALTGYAIKELPIRLRSASESTAKMDSTASQ